MKNILSAACLTILQGAFGITFPPPATVVTDHRAVFFLNKDVGVAVGYTIQQGVGTYGLFKKTTDGGLYWTTVNGPSSSSPLFLAFSDASRGWTSDLHTIDGGSTWGTIDPARRLAAAHFLNASRGWALRRHDSSVVRTTDAGVTWSPIARWTPPAASNTLVPRIVFVDTLRGWLTQGTSSVSRTTDGGITWSSHPTTSSATLHALHFANANVGWTVGTAGVIMKTTDGGITWNAQASNVTGTLRVVRFTDPDSGWVVGDGALLQTVNGGANWISHPMTANLHDIFLFNGTEGWVAGGGILNRMSKGTVAIAEPVARNNPDIRLQGRRLTYFTRTTGPVRITMRDIRGAGLRILAHGSVLPGEHEITLPAKARGLYLLDLQLDQSRYVRGILLP